LVDRDTETFVLTVYVAFARSGRSTVYSGVIEAPEATKSEGKILDSISRANRRGLTFFSTSI